MTKYNYVNTRIRLTYRMILLPKIESGSRFKSEPGPNLKLRTWNQLFYGAKTVPIFQTKYREI